MNLKITEKIKSDEILTKIRENFDNEIYLVGGAVRDFLLDKASYDRDLIVIDEDAKNFSMRLAEFFNGVFVPLDEENKIYRVVLPDKTNYFDVTNPADNSLEKDLLRRDLTINAIAVNLKTFEVVDLCGGIIDLQHGVLNCINEYNFIDDPLRLLRVYRFQAILGFELSPFVIEAECKYADLIAKPASERINYELIKLFSGQFAFKALLNMDKTGLLEKIFPIINELKQVPPNTHHHLGLFYHSVETVKQLSEIYENAIPQVKEHMNSVEFGGASRTAHLKLAAFLHDIGKFSTWTIEEDTGRHRFMKHEDAGAKLAAEILRKKGFSNKQIDYISKMIRNHLYPAQVMSASDVNEKSMMRYIRKMENESIDAILLAQADRLSARGEAVSVEMVENNINGLNRLLNFYLSVKDTLEPLPKLLTGNDVMKILGIKPSPALGEIMNALHEAQMNGDIKDRETAIEFVYDFHKNIQIKP